ncbi:MAG: tryptophan synthase subunit alpha [Clostridiales Family XIII bacterium]|jgi:tryptophan synthase alpha chain|nr:tryptophan synthase subunit alpha [Clostridiales Family XIII bacterium]
MSNIAQAFSKKKAFVAFLTGGDPTIASTKEYILRMIEAGADLIEIGIPFSDPIAEGIVIQEANIRALAHGTTVDKLFDLVDDLRKNEHVTIPLCFMTYLNPVFHYGYDTFFAKAKAVGLDGIIIPDLPFEEQAEVKTVSEQYGIDTISLIAPTSEDRIEAIAKEASGFIYLVSSLGVTGVRSKITTDLSAITKIIKANSDVSVAIGFGISTPKQAAQMSKKADGVIVGSAIVRIIAAHGEDAGDAVYEYVKSLVDAI